MIDLRFSEAELERQREHITQFVRDQVAAANADGVVLGFSGGIDSTLTGYLTVDALGTDHVHGLVLPGTVSSEGHMSDAERVAQDLGISYDVIAIEPIIGALLSAYPDAEGDHEAVGNARARVRAVLNYLVANHEGRLVVGTGNRSEAAVGYFTKYGDGAVDCHPIGNLYKQQVRQLASHVGVSEELVEKTATAELWADQTDEEELGISYETLDDILATHIDGPLSVAATCRLLEVEEATVEKVRRMYEQSEHKRTVPPAPEPLE
ncbi:NAD+ synthase [Natrinema gelatinilyticum]|uniref:NAD+ synthase n=1 Tax=Natrinema gelatinilyticum TaxID=2961571 RepID=UPI0020C552D8|nr:NAD+ synthase [Natrinema gelatinilyticum]